VEEAVIANDVDTHWLTTGQVDALRSLTGRRFVHVWRFNQALAEASPEWRMKPNATVNKKTNEELKQKLEYLERLFKVVSTFSNPTAGPF
jgi:hypothetical protein